MKIELEPTNEFQDVNGGRTRIWKGVTDKGVPVLAWIACVSPQTHDAEANEQFARELREVKSEHRAHPYDLRLFID